jgi:fumarate reductase flavoprotein subunit
MRPRAERVAIVGGGLAGTACALRLAELDPARRVTLYDQDAVGGTSAFSVGSLTAAGTKWQRDAGITDTPAEHLQTLLAMCSFDGDAADLARYRTLLASCCDAASAALETLASWGLTFAGPFLEPPHPKPRMHNVVASGAAMMTLLRMRLETAGIDVRELAPVHEIRRAGEGFEIVAEPAPERFDDVVVACGDRAARTSAVPGLNPRATGEPIEMAARLCHAKEHVPQFAAGLRAVAPGAPWIEPARDVVLACEVRAGEETIEPERFLADLPAFASRDVYLSVKEPARLAGRRVSTFPAIGYATLEDWMRTPLVHRRDPLEIGPFRVVVSFVDGALDVDGAMRVLGAGAAAEPHLFACGSAGVGGMRLEGHGHHLIWAAYSGMRAAEAIAGRE